IFAWNFTGTFTLTATASNVKYNDKAVSLQAATSQSFGVSPFPPDRQPPGTVTSFGSRRQLKFVTGFELPDEAPVGSALVSKGGHGEMKVQELDPNGNVITNDNSTVIVMKGGGHITGTLTQTVVNGIATFDDLALSGSGLTADPLPVQFLTPSVASIAPLDAKITQKAGAPYNLIFKNTNVKPKVIAGTYVVDNSSGDGAALEVDVVDQYGNIVDSDDSTMVSLGLLPTQGRGPVFVGNSSIPGDQHPAAPG